MITYLLGLPCSAVDFNLLNENFIHRAEVRKFDFSVFLFITLLKSYLISKTTLRNKSQLYWIKQIE